ncbi:TetR/AcrR family transcriptional regulator [Paraburkholderia sp. BCC1885]|uniref:TetR/AcrR family transcriptional regulator n=1 Tax=Paraburkholderia sp. BCC1885 TaxID=2562669 RepID=UPI00164259D5|nr:TetR/AcrR family transcriptional regulator [Paraburkholderia sp. BCC1885]
MDAILEAAALVLEAGGFESYTTNHIAERAGVSIGSLYQYFPNKDAVTVALIEREASNLASRIAALDQDDWKITLLKMIEIISEHEQQRPRLSRLLDSEEVRLKAESAQRESADRIRAAIMDLLDAVGKFPLPTAVIASDLMAITRSLSDLGPVETASASQVLARRIEWAVLGYLTMATE